MRYLLISFATLAIGASLKTTSNTSLDCNDQAIACTAASSSTDCSAVYQTCAIACINTYNSCSATSDPTCDDTLHTCLGAAPNSTSRLPSDNIGSTNSSDVALHVAKRAPNWYFPDPVELCRARGLVFFEHTTTNCLAQRGNEFTYTCRHPSTDNVRTYVGVCQNTYTCQQVNNDGTAPRTPIPNPYTQSRALCVRDEKSGTSAGRGDTGRVCPQQGSSIRKFFGKVYSKSKETLKRVIYVTENRGSGEIVSIAGQEENVLEYDLSYNIDPTNDICIYAIIIAALTIPWGWDSRFVDKSVFPPHIG